MYQVAWNGRAVEISTVGQTGVALITLVKGDVPIRHHKLLDGGFQQFEIACTEAPDKVMIDLMDGPKLVRFATLYVCRYLLNSYEFRMWFMRQGFVDLIPEAELHCTVCYSATPMFWPGADKEWHEVPPSPNRFVEQFGDALVQRFDCPYLTMQNDGFRQLGATSNFPDYKPHVTISYGFPPIPMGDIIPYTGTLLFGPEVFAPVNENYKTDKGLV